jgi:hypothetical protein
MWSPFPPSIPPHSPERKLFGFSGFCAALICCLTFTSAHAVEVEQLPIRLGDTYEAVKEAYQTPLEPEPNESSAIRGSTNLHLKTKGVWFFFDRTGKIYTIRLDAPFPGKVGGVNIGDSVSKMMKVLGKPAKSPAPINNMFPRSYIYYLDDVTTARFQTTVNGDEIETIFLIK